MNPVANHKTPGAYSYEDASSRRLSHNKSQKRVFINQERRFGDSDGSPSPNRGGPGPGAYLDKDDMDLQHYSGMLLL